MDQRTIAEKIFLSGVERVMPTALIPGVMSLQEATLFISDLRFSLYSIDNIYVIGAGKASAAMAKETEKILEDLIVEGFVSVKYGHSCSLKYIKVAECGHPVPDANGFNATGEILKIAQKAGTNDLVICLLSGGGSALMPDFPPGSSPDEIMLFNNLLVNCGASIGEINTVRKHLSLVKGGQLARAVYPARMVNLIISDVPGDRPDIIASGPATADPSTFEDALNIIEKFNLREEAPAGIIAYLEEGVAGRRPETPKPGDPLFERVCNIIIGNNRKALEGAAKRASELKIRTKIWDELMQGDVMEIASQILEASLKLQSDKNEVKPVCLLFGGEPTVRMTGCGEGGRNQHLALLLAQLLVGHPGITILCAGTDGTDGPTGAAGAVVDYMTVPEATLQDIDAARHTLDFDSYSFFKKAGGHIITGPTMTNVMDIVVVLIWQGLTD